jgi:hypothetical protein
MVTPKGSMLTEGETLQVSVLPYRCSKCAPLDHHNWLSFGKFQETARFLIPCPCHVSSRLPPRGETCKYATAPSIKKNLERFSNYWYAPFRCVCLTCCAAKFRSSGGTYELPCIYSALSSSHISGKLQMSIPKNESNQYMNTYEWHFTNQKCIRTVLFWVITQWAPLL